MMASLLLKQEMKLLQTFFFAGIAGKQDNCYGSKSEPGILWVISLKTLKIKNRMEKVR